jgi:hypothetical protein
MDVKVIVFMPGPTSSFLTQPAAASTVEIAAAICAFVTGGSIQASPVIFPADEEQSAHARLLQRDRSIPELSHRGVSLDIFGNLESLGGNDAVSKATGALLAYHAAMQQANPDVAMLLLVSAIEALIVPKPRWKINKATNRFIVAVNDLCPEAVDALLARRNVEAAFSFKKRGSTERQRKALVDKIYELRSISAHSGLSPSGFGSMLGSINPSSMRLAPLMDLATAAILGFLEAPRSYLVGHPMWDDDAQPSQT